MTHSISKNHMVYTVAIIGFIYSLHLVIPMYSNSSFLGLFADEKTIGFIYMLCAAVSIFTFLIAPYVIRRIGNYTTILWLVLIQMGLFYGLITSTSPIKLSILFIIQYSIVALIGLSLDIFLEGYTSNHANVGKIRGLYASTLNASWVIAPLIGSLLINGTENYRNTYIAAFLMLFPLAYLIYKNFPRFKDPHYSHPSPWQLIKHISQNSNWDKLFVANTILQTFYSWMVIYSAVYLNKYVGFGWEQIGIILVIMLIPFPLIQYPLGKIADEKYGEKEIMVAGFIIMGLSTISLAFISGKSLFVWALFFFITRIGAAMVEMMIETYFFKTVPPKDTPVLSMFRITRPFSYLIAPLVTGFGLLFMGHQHLFILVGIIVLIGLYPALTIQDTK